RLADVGRVEYAAEEDALPADPGPHHAAHFRLKLVDQVGRRRLVPGPQPLHQLREHGVDPAIDPRGTCESIPRRTNGVQHFRRRGGPAPGAICQQRPSGFSARRENAMPAQLPPAEAARRVIANLRELAALTATPDGAQRLAWGPVWRKAREWFAGK